MFPITRAGGPYGVKVGGRDEYERHEDTCSSAYAGCIDTESASSQPIHHPKM
jgi:hypothetical protein